MNKILLFKKEAKSLNRDSNSINELKMWIRANKILEIALTRLVPSEPSVTFDSYNECKTKLENNEQVDPIQVALLDGENYVVVDGNNRAKAFKDLGKITVPAILVDIDTRSRQKYLLSVLKKFNHLKGFDNLPIDESIEKRQERYSAINFTYCSKDKIENTIPESNSILISIAGVNDEFAKIATHLYKDVLKLRFSDVQRDFGKFIAFKDYQAKSIIAFVDRNLPVDFVYVNCEQGKSRSAGVVTALEKIYNNTDVFIPTHNSLVKNVLLSI